MMGEIEMALKVHKSVKNDLRATPIILSTPDVEILHPLYLPQREIDKRERWFEGGDHKFLMRLLSEGRVPYRWGERNHPESPITTTRAYKTARARGYSVPEKFFSNREVSFTEREAFYAGHMIARGHFKDIDPYRNYIEGDNYRTLTHLGEEPSYKDRFDSFRSSLCQLTGQFIVPDPLEEWKAPYLLDQLWIMLYPSRKVRLIGLEVDGEVHLEPEQRARDKRRDVMLASMGYEIYHVAGWWCRIDPFRVICEFLSASKLLPDAHKRLVTSHFRTMDDYVCDYCGNPLYRRDADWIQGYRQRDEEDGYRERNLVVHGCCAERMATLPDY